MLITPLNDEWCVHKLATTSVGVKLWCPDELLCNFWDYVAGGFTIGEGARGESLRESE